MKRRAVFCLLVLGIVILFFLGKNAVVPALISIDSYSDFVLILDPGHGGEDGGAVSAAGDKESDINLEISQKLELLMAFIGVRTVLTRESDVSIHDDGLATLREKKISDLKNRVSLINKYHNAMLISVHQNSFTDPNLQGAQTFYSDGELSYQWAGYTQEYLRSILGQNNDRSAMHIPESVYLFQNVYCPSILVECGFLSNELESRLLLSDSYQLKISMAIVGAFVQQIHMIPSPLGGDSFGKK